MQHVGIYNIELKLAHFFYSPSGEHSHLNLTLTFPEGVELSSHSSFPGFPVMEK